MIELVYKVLDVTNNIQKGGSMTQNQISYWNLVELQRSNLAKEKENNRHNIETEKQGSQTIDVNRLGTLGNLDINRANLSELQRSNLAKERENARNNQANNLLTYLQRLTESRNAATREFEAGSGRIQAQAAASQAGTAANMYQETRRSNLVNDAIKALQQQENKRHNIAQENTNRLQTAGNIGNTGSQINVQQGQLSESERHNVVSENETKRNNLFNQQLKAAELQDTINYHKGELQNQSLRNLVSPLRLSMYTGGAR